MRHDLSSKQRLVEIFRKKSKEIENLESQVFFLKSGISKLKERRDILNDKVKEFARSGKVGAIAMNIIKAFKDGKFHDKEALLSMLHVTLNNLNRQSNYGRRYLDTKEDNNDYTEYTKDYYYVLKAWGEPRRAMFVALNNCGPNIRTVSRWVKDKCYQYKLGLEKDNLHYVTNVIREAMEAHGIKHSVPCVTAEDKTRIIERIEYNQAKDEAWGFCGKKKKITSAKKVLLSQWEAMSIAIRESAMLSSIIRKLDT